MHSNRTITTYDPFADLDARHAGWSIEESDLHGLGEVVDLTRRLILVDPSARGEQYAVAHAVAHLDLGHVVAGRGGSFSRAEERDAHWLAQVRIDSEDDRECA